MKMKYRKQKHGLQVASLLTLLQRSLLISIQTSWPGGLTLYWMNLFPGPCSGCAPPTQGGIWVPVTLTSCQHSEESVPTLHLIAGAGKWWNTSGSQQIRNSWTFSHLHQRGRFRDLKRIENMFVKEHFEVMWLALTPPRPWSTINSSCLHSDRTSSSVFRMSWK